MPEPPSILLTDAQWTHVQRDNDATFHWAWPTAGKYLPPRILATLGVPGRQDEPRPQCLSKNACRFEERIRLTHRSDETGFLARSCFVWCCAGQAISATCRIDRDRAPGAHIKRMNWPLYPSADAIPPNT